MSKHTAEHTVKRLAAVRAAAARPGYSSWSTGPRTQQGRRKMAANATKHGADSVALQWAVAYAEAVLEALPNKKDF